MISSKLKRIHGDEKGIVAARPAEKCDSNLGIRNILSILNISLGEIPYC